MLIFVKKEGTAVVLGKWNIWKDHSLPGTIAMLVKDSKVYMIGGEYLHGNPRCESRTEECMRKASLSELVYEICFSDGGSQLSFVACSSVPRLPRLVPAPIIIQHLGEIYVLYGQLRFNKCRKHLNTKIESENCFVKLGKDGKQWKSLTPPPFYLTDIVRYMWYLGGVGSKLCVSLAGQLNSYDIKKNEWEEMSDLYWHQKGIITLSLYPEAEDEVCYVVIIPKLKGEHRRIDAALVDGEGNRSHIQHVHQVTGNDEISSFKLIELEFEKKDAYNGSSTFALVFNSDDKMIGLTMIKVSISVFGAKKVEHVAKGKKLLQGSEFSEEGSEFLKVEVLLNRRYEMEAVPGDLYSQHIVGAFFY